MTSAGHTGEKESKMERKKNTVIFPITYLLSGDIQYRKVHLKPVYSRWISIFFELCRQAFVLMHTGRPEWLFDIRFVYSLFPLCITPRGIATSHFLSLTAFSLLWTGNHYLTINICRLSYFLQCASAITKFSKI